MRAPGLVSLFMLLSVGSCFEIMSFSTAAVLDPLYFNSPSYLFFYLLFWNLLIEISLVIVVHFKQNPGYLLKHYTLNMLAFLGQRINDLLNGEFFWIQNPYRLLSVATLLLELLQLFLGMGLFKKLSLTALPRRIFLFRATHRLLGYVIYLLHKVMLSIYAYYYLTTNNMDSLVPLIYVVLIVTVSTHIGLRLIFASAEFKGWRLNLAQETELKSEKHAEILQNLQIGDYESFAEESVRISTQEAEYQKQLIPAEKRIQWVLIEDKVFDITDLSHPKGQFIFAQATYKDITREVYGLKSFRVENRKEQISRTLKHKHHPRTFLSIQNRCFGEIGLGDLMVQPKGARGFKTNLEDPDSSVRISKLNTETKESLFTDWSVDALHGFSAAPFFVGFVSNKPGKVLVNISNYWLRNFGKYFLVKQKDGRKHAFYLALSLSPKYISLKKNFYASLGSEFGFLNDDSLYDSDVEQLRKLVTTLAGPMVNGPRSSIKERDVLEKDVPLLLGSQKVLKEQESLTLIGPLGMGLGFDTNTTKDIFVVINDEGVLPFVDCFEFFSQKALLELVGETATHPVFGNEYRYTYANQIRLFVCLVVSPQYENTMKSLALNTLTLLAQLYKNKKAGSIKKIVEQVTVVSSSKSLKSEWFNYSSDTAVEFNRLMNLSTAKSEMKNVEKVIVSGSDKFVDSLMKDCFFPLKDILIL